MISIDLRTLVFSFVITNIIVTLIMVMLWYQNRKRFAGTFLWVINFLFQTTALVLIALRGSIPDLISMVVSNALVISGTILGLIALDRFVGIKRNNLHNYILLVLFVFLSIWFSQVKPDLAVRNLNLSATMLIITFQCSWLIFFKVKSELRKIAAGVGMVFLAYSLVNVLRIADFFFTDHSATDYFDSGKFEMFVLISYQMLFILLTYNLALMFNKRLLTDVEAQEEKFSKAFQSSPYAIILTRLADGKIFEVNKGFEDISGYNSSEVIGVTTNDLKFWYSEEERNALVEELARLGKVIEKELRFRKKSGEPLICLMSSEIISINDEKCVLSSINDITNSKQAEKELIASEERYSLAISASEQGIWDWNIETNEVFFSRQWKKQIGYEDHEIENTFNSWINLLHPDEKESCQLAVQAYLNKPTEHFILEFRFRHKDGSYRFIHNKASSVKNEHGKVIRMFGTHSDITERKVYESDLKRTQLLLRATLESPVVMIILAIDLNFNYLSFNNAHKAVMKSAYGTEVEAGMNLFECMAGDTDIVNAKENYTRAMKGESFITVQEYGDKERSYYETFYNPIRNENGEIVGATAFARDISERIGTELALKESEEKFRNLFEHSPVGKSITGIDGTIKVNRAFCKILDYSEDELKAKNWKDISHPDDIKMTDDIVKLLLKGETDNARFEKRYIHKNGNTVFTDVATYLQRDIDGSPEYFITTINDITDRKKAEDKLKLSEEKFRSVIESSPTGMHFYTLDDKDNLIFTGANPSADRILGIQHNEHIGNTILEAFPNLAETHIPETYLNVALGKADLQKFEIKYGEKRFTGYFDVTVFRSGTRNITVDFVDILDRKLAEQEVLNLNNELDNRVKERTSQLEAANKELEAFSYSVSHDLRAPLRAIHSFTSILKEDYKDTLDNDGKRICGIIETSSVHMGQLIDDLLSFSRIGRTELRIIKIDMSKAVKTVFNELINPDEMQRISFKVEKLPSAFGDSATIKQVLINLISNSIKYTSKNQNAEILVSCEKDSDPPVYYVKDNGVGFDMQYVSKLFGVFQRLHSAKEFEGNGVGLAIVQRIIHRHGGKVWAEAEVGKGATFYFTIPGSRQ